VTIVRRLAIAGIHSGMQGSQNRSVDAAFNARFEGRTSRSLWSLIPSGYWADYGYKTPAPNFRICLNRSSKGRCSFLLCALTWFGPQVVAGFTIIGAKRLARALRRVAQPCPIGSMFSDSEDVSWC
jgi:hypothetical protein